MEEETQEEIKVNKKGKSKLKVTLIIIAIAIAGIFVYIRFIATSGFIVKEYAVESEKLPENFNGFKIAHLSDIHYASVGKEALDKIVDEVNKMKPDIIVFTGDLYDEYSNLTEDMKLKIIDSLSKLSAPSGKYAVSGNHDYKHDGYKDIITGSGFTYLHNESKLIYYLGDEPIEIVGYPDEREDQPDYSIELTDNYKIALIHEGDSYLNIKDKDFDLVLAGHSHGGQVRLPFIGVIYKVNGAKKYYDAHYKEGKTDIYVSSGIGEVEYKIRAFNKRSFNFYRLYKK